METSSSQRRLENGVADPAQSPISNPRSLFSPSIEKLALVLILCLALFLRFYCLTCSSYWHDEGNTWALIQRSFGQIAADAAADIHPPGYYWLLKLWSFIFGHTPWALRAFSALTGTLTVAVVYAIARTVASHRSSVVALLAALFAALNPFQIFYSQEARMYSLLMLECTALVWVALREGKRQKEKAKGRYETQPQFTIRNSQFIISFSLFAAAGLWTHYIFPVVLVAVSLAWLLSRSSFTIHNSQFTIHHSPLPFLFANLLAFLLFLPWLPTAIQRILSWPAGGAHVTAFDGLHLTLQTLAVGPIRSGPQLAWPWLLLIGLLPLFGLWRLRCNPAAPILALWFFAPVGLMFGLGLFTDSFLKFLLVASPAWCVLTAYCVLHIPYSDSRRDAETQRKKGRGKSHVSRFTQYAAIVATYAMRNTQYAIPFLAIILAYATLPAYYTDPAARDNYAGMAATVAALGDPATDAVILDAPGQADVWRIYDPGLPVLTLPQQRPPDRTATEAALAAAVAERDQLFALFWATEQADPEGIVEGWLNRKGFKGLESWQGNVRFVQYSLPNQLTCESLSPPARFGDDIQLTRVCLPQTRSVVAGASLPVSLHWQTDVPINRRYKATIQLLDSQNQVVGQQDGEPGGGSLPTDRWQPGAEIVDNRGLYAPPGAPPISYRLALALYDEETGQRLSVAGSDALELGQVGVSRPPQPLPTEIVPMHARLNRSIGPLELAGFDAYAKGFAHETSQRLSPGELLHITLYWKAPTPLPSEWPDDLSYTLQLSGIQTSARLAGNGFPTGSWQAGDFVRGDIDIVYTSDGPLILAVDGVDLRLGSLVNGGVR